MPSFGNILDKKSEAYAYYTGAQAYREKVSRINNPFNKGTRAWEDWLNGYLDAEFLDIRIIGNANQTNE